jgi:hypothetical protein
MLSKAIAKQALSKSVSARQLPKVSFANFQSIRNSATTTWSADDSQLVQTLVNEISQRQMESTKSVIPWFLRNMPVSVVRSSFLFFPNINCAFIANLLSTSKRGYP